MDEKIKARLWSKIDVRGPDDCWLWRSGEQDGYGNFRVNRAFKKAHRLVWELTNGPVPEGLQVRHMCEDRYVPEDITCRRCCNPKHLAIGTKLENAADSMRAKRQNIREKCHNFKYTDEQVLLCVVYRVAGRTQQEIANIFGIPRRTVRQFISCRPVAKNAEFSRCRSGL